jgi:hypothetical protein
MRLGGNGMEEIFPPISMTSGPGRKNFPPISSTNVGFGDDINCGFVVFIFEQRYNGHFINVKIMLLVI